MGLLAPYAAEHAKPTGAGDDRPTALKIVRDQNLVGKLSGKVALVTGCTSGIGIETARALHGTGADVYITARNVAKGQEVVKDIESHGWEGKVEVIEMELDSFESIKKGVENFLSKSKTLNLLINNAGVMATPEGTTKDGFETQFGTNHLGHFLLFQLLKPTLLESSTRDFNSRVVSLSSTGHRTPAGNDTNSSAVDFDDFNFKTRGYDRGKAYGQSKTSNVWFANELDRRYGSKGLHAFSLHPGGIWSGLQKHSEDILGKYRGDPNVEWYMKNAEQGAATSVWAALAKELEGKGGLYLENCQEIGPAEWTAEQLQNPLRTGYAPWAYNEQAEKRLWVESLKLVGIADDQ